MLRGSLCAPLRVNTGRHCASSSPSRCDKVRLSFYTHAPCSGCDQTDDVMLQEEGGREGLWEKPSGLVWSSLSGESSSVIWPISDKPCRSFSVHISWCIPAEISVVNWMETALCLSIFNGKLNLSSRGGNNMVESHTAWIQVNTSFPVASPAASALIITQWCALNTYSSHFRLLSWLSGPFLISLASKFFATQSHFHASYMSAGWSSVTEQTHFLAAVFDLSLPLKMF